MSFQVANNTLVKYIGFDRFVVIPEGITIIGPNAFQGNTAIECVDFSNTVVRIENNAFEGCKNLEDIRNYNSIQYFGAYSFNNCGIRELTIGKNVKTILEYAFSNMCNLEILYYCPEENIIQKNTFIKCPNLKKVDMDMKYFYPAFGPTGMSKKKEGDNRPSFFDVFRFTPYYKLIMADYKNLYKKKICPDCGGTIKKGLFNAKCTKCNIAYKFLVNTKVSM